MSINSDEIKYLGIIKSERHIKFFICIPAEKRLRDTNGPLDGTEISGVMKNIHDGVWI